MSGFLLVPVDGGNPVPVPPGETLLGRGPLLRISDKRVSRNHGLLQNQNRELRLKPTHVNPCFIQASLWSEPRPLPRGCWYTLRHGELFSLLPGRLVFRVEAVGGDEGPSRSAVEDGQRPAAGGAQQEGEESHGRSRQTNERLAARSEVRVRILPAWMMAAAGHSPALTLKVQSAAHRSKRPAGGVEATPPSASLPEEAGPKEEEEQRKRRKRTAEEEQTVVPAGASALSTRREPDQRDGKNDPGGSSTDTSAPAPPTATPTSRRRAPCPYGKDCYRKNPLHFQESSHPGDPDYEEAELQEEEADRPECPYGTDCYRKNPLHRREYKHTGRAARSTRTAPPNPPDDEEDEDGFIDDDSEDPDEDSDYNPAPSDDSDGEDMRRLQREAAAFLKRRK